MATDDDDDDEGWRSLFGGEQPVTREPEAATALAKLRRDMFATAVAPVRLGKLTVLERLGRGGMGVVYAAYDPELDRRVAVKVLHLRSEDAARRALREGRALAQVTHPNVVVVHAVQAVRGRIHIVMEYVDGGTLRQWLQTPRPWKEVVSLYIDAGRGLHAAHQAGLIHGDFKPDNVLVDKAGRRPRVADFGLAVEQALPSEPQSVADGSDATRRGGGTAGYTAPQVLRGAPADACADQFSFCVSLYEGLYAARPFTPEQLREGGLDGVAFPTGRVPGKVQRALARGLHDDPSRRFASMEALVAALRAATHPPTARNVGLVAGVVGIGTGVLVASQTTPGDSCVAAPEALAERWTALRAKTRDALRATGHPQAQAVAVRVEAAADAYVSAWAQAWGRACSDGAAISPEAALRQRCLVDRRRHFEAFVDALGAVQQDEVFHVANAAAAIEDPNHCFSGPASTLPAPAPEHTAEIGRGRTTLARARADTELARHDDALALADEVLAVARRVQDGVLLAEALYARAQADENIRDAAQASEGYAEALWQAYRVGHHRIVALSANHLVRLGDFESIDSGDGAWWLRLAEQAVAVVDPQGPVDALTRLTRARLLARSGRLQASKREVEAALAISERTDGARHTTVADALLSLGAITSMEGHLSEALAIFDDAAAIYAEALFPTHPRVREALRRKADTLRREGRSADALALLRALLVDEASARGQELLSVAEVYGLIGETLRGTRQYADAIAPLEKSLALRIAVGPPETIGISQEHETLATALAASGRPEAAEEHFREALRIKRAVLGNTHWRVGPSLINLAAFLHDQGSPNADVVALVTEGIRIASTAERIEPVETFWLHAIAARVLRECGQAARARTLVLAALADAGDAEIPRAQAGLAYMTLARANLDLGRTADAAEALAHARDLAATRQADPRGWAMLDEIEAQLDRARGTAH